MIRAVLDPNVLVSALISPQGVPARILGASEERRFRLVVSEGLISELEDVLMREKFRRYATVEQAEAHIQRVREVGDCFEDRGDFEAVSPDPKDYYLVALACASRADYLVSGDSHLHGLEGEDLPPVLTPRAFVDVLRSEDRTR